MAEEKTAKRGLLDILYGKNSKLFILIPVLLLIFSIFSINSFYVKTGDIMSKDVTLTGGTTLTVFSSEKIDAKDIESHLSNELGDAVVREVPEMYLCPPVPLDSNDFSPKVRRTSAFLTKHQPSSRRLSKLV